MTERNMEVRRGKCYHIVSGLELALRENLRHSFDIQDSGFNSSEKDRAVRRCCTEMKEQEAGYSQEQLYDLLTPSDFLNYLDIGDLCNLLNRHKASVRDAKQEHVQEVTNIINNRKLIAIRNRVMHSRPLHKDDYDTLKEAADELQEKARSMRWEPLARGVRHADRGDPGEIPSFWTIPNNLPEPDYGDTGFIGRRSERNELKRILESRRDVITVVGEGGRGKTALALRVCQDILEDHTSLDLDRIVWISLKSQYFTDGAVRDIKSAVLDKDTIVKNFGEAIGDRPELRKSADWEDVLTVMEESKILLVIDNLETLEDGSIRDLAFDIPQHSKLLLTTRVGLGEIERRYDIPPLSPPDSIQLMRELGRTYTCEMVAKASAETLKRWCELLDHNPMLMRWFVNAVAKGAEPREVFTKRSDAGYDDALRFCWDNVYSMLSDPSKKVVSVLLAAAQNLTRTQVRALTDMNAVELANAINELEKSNIVVRGLEEDGMTENVHIGSTLIHNYLIRNYPPELDLVDHTESSLVRWQGRFEYAVKTSAHRYSQNSILIATMDEAIAAQHLINALENMSKDMDRAKESLSKAEDLLPDWWEIHRVKARIWEADHMPQNAIINAHKESIEYKDLDVNRYHYAKYLMNISPPRFDAVVEQIDLALGHPDAVEPELKSMRGLALVRLGKIDEGIRDMEDSWNYDYVKGGLPALAPDLRLRLGTQIVDAHRRQLESLNNQSTAISQNEAAAVAVRAFRRTSEVAGECGWDRTLVEKAIDLIEEIVRQNFDESVAERLITSHVSKWDSSQDFLKQCPRLRDKELNRIRRNSKLAEAIPNTSKMVENLHTLPRVSGVVKYIHRDRSHGYISTAAESEDVYMTQGSFRHPREWETLEMRQRVTFSIDRTATQGPRAMKVELTDGT